MKIRQNGGLTEFIPNPREMRDGHIRDHALELLENLHRRIREIEERVGVSLDLADDFTRRLGRIQDEEFTRLKTVEKKK